MTKITKVRFSETLCIFAVVEDALFSGPPSQLELRSSGGAGEWHGDKMGLYQLMPEKRDPVYRQRHDGDNENYYIYRWDINCPKHKTFVTD